MSTGSILPVYRWQVFYDGQPAAGALAYFWLSGTSTPQDVYSNAALSSARTNPVEADADGVFPIIYLAAVAYRVEIRTADGTVIFPAQDGIYDLFQIFEATAQDANTVFAGPASGSPAAPTFRALVVADLPIQTGTWTPVIGGSGGTSGQTYTAQVGKYFKLGPFVLVQCFVQLSAKGTITTNVQIQGLPFASSNVTNQYSLCPIYFSALSTNWVAIQGLIAPNTSVVGLAGVASAGTTSAAANLAASDIGDTTQIIFTLSYQTDS